MPAVNGTFCVTLMSNRCINARMPGKCATCAEVCPHGVFAIDRFGHLEVHNYNACVGCRICAEFCPEDALRINPAESEMVARWPWTFSQVEEIHAKAQSGSYALRGFGTMGKTPHFDDIIVVPSQIASPPPLDKYREDCDMTVTIGEGTCENPITLQLPFLFPAMSLGALSREARMALSIGAASTGILNNTGEGGLLRDELWLVKGYENEARTIRRWEPGGFLAVQWSTGRWGVSVDYLRSGDAVEVKIGQGAKPGMGGHLLGKKVTPEIAAVRGVPVGSDALSPCRYYDVTQPDDMKRTVAFIREATDYKVPILFKLGPSRPYEDIKACVEAGADAISIDGLVGGTGASPQVVTQGVGIPTVALIPPAVQALKDLGVHRKVKLFVLGGIRNGLDAYKCIAMGADGVGFGAAAEIAIGCRACMACHTGNCPYGITSQDPNLRSRLDPYDAGHKLANFIEATAEELKMLTMLSGHKAVSDLTEEDVRAMTVDTAAITGLKLVGYERRMPWWESMHNGHNGHH